ncbi:hypothetical protein [Isoptericola croceus]|uniref:hypothetical protein n=1 Tax=Isoptericola croceus TaxID=3031406 RepID=UPI0023F6FADE|nr:hypothetical protein [Isoptericola croceus]
MSTDITPAGRFLCELSQVERAQPRATVSRIAFGDAYAAVTIDGQDIVVPFSCDRTAIVERSQAQGIALHPPAVGEADGPIPAEIDEHTKWVELLDDLGSYSGHLNHADPDLTLEAIGRRVDGVAVVEASNGRTSLHFTINLRDGELPVAVPVDIAADFGMPGTPRKVTG